MNKLALLLVLVGCRGGGDKSASNSPSPEKGGPLVGGAPGGGETGSSGTRGSRELLVEPGDMSAMGNIDKDVVKTVVKQNIAKLQLCYEQTLLANPGIEGKVVVTFTIGIDGTVLDVAAVGIHPDVETCVAGKVRSFKFPKPDGGGKVEVSYPFSFRPA
ncbi:MAG: AgmX/PglI C-terminal domain-containing protein [Kofleriaceae bacterium]